MNERERNREPVVINPRVALEYEMYRQRTDPRTVLTARLLQAHPSGRWETMVGTRSDLITRIARGAKRREFGRIEEIRSLGGSMWSVDVWRIREEPPRWRKPVIIAGSVLAVLGALAGLGLWVWSATTDALAGHTNGVFVAGILIGLGALAIVFRRPVVEVIVKVK